MRKKKNQINFLIHLLTLNTHQWWEM